MPTRKLSTTKLLRLDLYVLKEVMSVFLGTFFFVLFILLMFQCLRLSEFFIVHGASGQLLAKIVFYLTLSFLPFALPLAFIFSLLVGFSRLSNDSELIALKAHGLSLIRISAPIFGFSVLIATFTLLLNLKLVPWSSINFKRTEYAIGKSRIVSKIKEGTFTSGFFGLLIFADQVDQKKNRMYRVFIHDDREKGSPLTYVAQEAELIPLKAASEFGTAILLNLYNGSMHHHHIPNQSYEKIDFKTYQLILEMEVTSPDVNPKPSMMSSSTLNAEIQRHINEPLALRELHTEYWRRYATAISPLFLVLLGIGLGAFRSRSARSGTLLMGFIILLSNWTLQVLSTEMSLRGWLPPFIVMQIPNLVLLISGVHFFRKSSW